MSATVCFFLATALQCNTVAYPATWPTEGTGARLCANGGDVFRCQNISREDGFELVRKYQCQSAQTDVAASARKTQDARRELELHKKWLRDAELAKPNPRGTEWERFQLQLYKKDPAYASLTGNSVEAQEAYIGKLERAYQKRREMEVAAARERVDKAKKKLDDPLQKLLEANAQARASKWCRPPDTNARPLSKPAKALAVPLDDPNPHDFPLASCKSWDGTVTNRSGIDTENATMSGIVTRANVEEYCNRIVGEDRPARDAAVAECLQHTLPAATKAALAARANCKEATLEFSDGSGTKRIRFPTEDTSCGSGNPPLISQFRKLCPIKASELALE